MGLFGNEAKKQAKRRSVDDWMLWSYEVRVASNEAAVAVASGLEAGHSAADLAIRLFMTAWEGAAREAVSYYPQHQVQAAYEDQSLRKRAVALLSANQVNQTLIPPFTPELIRQLQASMPSRESARSHRARRSGRVLSPWMLIRSMTSFKPFRSHTPDRS